MPVVVIYSTRTRVEVSPTQRDNSKTTGVLHLRTGVNFHSQLHSFYIPSQTPIQPTFPTPTHTIHVPILIIERSFFSISPL